MNDGTLGCWNTDDEVLAAVDNGDDDNARIDVVDNAGVALVDNDDDSGDVNDDNARIDVVDNAGVALVDNNDDSGDVNDDDSCDCDRNGTAICIGVGWGVVWDKSTKLLIYSIII